MKQVTRESLASVPLMFRPPFIDKVIQKRHKGIVNEITKEIGFERKLFRQQTLARVLNMLYSILSESYRCEYIYKNVIANELFSNRHNCDKAHLISEFWSGDSRADIVILNDTSSVYEIKTKFDSLNKLSSQITSYKKLFDKIYVVTDLSLLKRVLTTTDPIVGILILGNDLSLTEIRQAMSNKDNTSPAHMFDCMRRNEYVSAIQKVMKKVPDVPNAKMYTEYKEIFCEFKPRLAHSLMVNLLRERNDYPLKSTLFGKLPTSLKHLWLELSGSEKYLQRAKVALMNPCL